MEILTLRDYASQNNIVSFAPAIRATPENGYLFVTFHNADNQAINVMFSKGASAQVSVGQDVASVLKDYQIVQYLNEAGEPRTKLSRKGGTRVAIDVLFE